jgi:hypothetical protein
MASGTAILTINYRREKQARKNRTIKEATALRHSLSQKRSIGSFWRSASAATLGIGSSTAIAGHPAQEKILDNSRRRTDWLERALRNIH